MEMEQPKYPEITVKLTGEDGNVFSIMARVSSALRRNVSYVEAADFCEEIQKSGSYDEALQCVMRWVNTK